MWREYNPNPETKKVTRGRRKGKKVLHADCVIRAFTLLLNKNWAETYMILAKKGIEKCDVFTQPCVWREFVRKADVKLDVSVNDLDDPRRHRKMTVKEVADLTLRNNKVYLCNSLGHVVVCKDGQYWDSWNSGRESVRSIWELR